MAIDTEQKRRAVSAMPLLPVALKPDGAIAGVDRQQVGWGYPGITVSAPSGADPSLYYYLLAAS